MSNENDGVVAHYARGDLMGRIRAALAGAGLDPDRPTVDMLRQLDHLHGGGFSTTKLQAQFAGIEAGWRVLDAGCGIGGPSRFLAATCDCVVDAIDLTPEYVDVANMLNAAVGLGDRITTQVASITDLPFEDRQFDAVWCQNVTMNVADKAAHFAEAFRVLKPGGVYTFTHLAEGPAGSPIYPLPWAMTPDVSFLSTPADLLAGLAAAGFADIADRGTEARQQAASTPPPGAIGASPAMGDDMPARSANVNRSLAEGRLVPMMVTAYRPKR